MNDFIIARIRDERTRISTDIREHLTKLIKRYILNYLGNLYYDESVDSITNRYKFPYTKNIKSCISRVGSQFSIKLYDQNSRMILNFDFHKYVILDNSIILAYLLEYEDLEGNNRYIKYRFYFPNSIGSIKTQNLIELNKELKKLFIECYKYSSRIKT